MFRKISTPNLFLFISISLFLLFWVGLKFFFSNHTISNEENETTLRLVSWIFLSLNLIVAIIIFVPRPIQFVVNESNLINLTIFILLISTLFSTKISAYITFLFLIFVIIFVIKKKPVFNPHPLLWVMLIYYAFQLIGLFWTIDIDSGIKFFDKGLSFIIIPLSFSFISLSSVQRDKILLVFFRFTIVFLLMGMLGYIFQIYFHKLDLNAGFQLKRVYLPPFLNLDEVYKQIFVGSGYGHPAYTSVIFSALIPLGFYFWAKEKTNKLRLTSFELLTYLILSASLIFILKSRVGLFMFPFGLLITILFMLRKSKKLYLIIGLIMVSGVISAYEICKYKIGFAFFSDPIRDNIYTVVFNYIKLHPWTGTGTGSMPLELLSTVNQAVNAHNQFVGEVFHLGIFGLLVFLLLITRIVYFGIRNRNFMLLYFIVIFTFLMMTEMPLAIQKGVSIFTLFCCLYARPEWKFKSGNSIQISDKDKLIE